MSRSVNIAMLIGNLTRDPEMRYTPKGSAVTSFGLATNRVWTTSEGERQEAADFHNIIAWGKLAEICNQFLRKGRKVYIKGRIHTSSWDTPEGVKKYKTEIVSEDMIILDSKRVEDFGGSVSGAPAAAPSAPALKKDDESVSPDEIGKGVEGVAKDSKKEGNPEGGETPF